MRKERNINTKGQSVEKEKEWRELAWLSIQDTYEDCTSTYSCSVFKLALMSHFTVICLLMRKGVDSIRRVHCHYKVTVKIDSCNRADIGLSTGF